MCKMCDAEGTERFKSYDLDLTFDGHVEKYVSSGEDIAQAAFLSGYKFATRKIAEAMENEGFMASTVAAIEVVAQEIGLKLVAEGASVVMVEHVMSPLEEWIMSFLDARLLPDMEPPATAEEEETFPADEGNFLSLLDEEYDESCGVEGCEYCG